MLKCNKGYEVKVLKSGAGYYVGTYAPQEGPNCRISGYFKSPTELTVGDLLLACTRICSENEFCNDGCGCQIKEEKDND